ncbi:uncharacterized protein B0P05DRAFT_449446, partial [Gilbertella persicaria]|uniref:uncharacterized protein n=1 Tax=Gilbertella persicaria TaxID=101096 RepID=UPI002220B2E0
LWWHEKVYMCRKSMELSYRMIPYIENDEPIITNVIRYIEDVSHCFKQQDLDRFQSIEYTEFFYTPTINTMTFDRETIKRLIQIIMALFLKHTTHFPPGLEALANTISTSIRPIELLFNMCCANDDDTTQLLDTVLTVYQQDMYCMTLLQHIQVNPHSLFLFFLQQCGSTHDILIDSLLNDSDFLAYFYRYVVYAHQDIHQFYAALVVLDMVNPFRWILRDTVRVLQGDGFPYNTKPLIRRLCMLQEQLLSL